MARAKIRIDKKRVDIPDIPDYKSFDIRPYLLLFVVLIIASLTLATFMKQEVKIRKDPPLPSTYYVDYTSGDDSNDGLSEATPWKTILRVNSESFNPGDTILFKRGETWREQLDVSSSEIIFSSYGVGENPVISAADLITGWTSAGSNMWFKNGVPTQPNIVYFNGVRGNNESSANNLDTYYEWYWQGGRLFVWSPNGLSPDIVYTSPGIEAGTRSSAIKISGKSYVALENLTLRHGNSVTAPDIGAGLNIDNSVYITIRNCVIEKNYGPGIQSSGVGDGGITISNCAIKENGLSGISRSGSSLISSDLIEDNIIQDNGWRQVSSSGILGSYHDGTIIRRNIISNNGFNDPNKDSHGIDLSYAQGTIEIYENIISNNLRGRGIYTETSTNIYRNLIYDNLNSGIASDQPGTTTITVNIFNNIIHSNGGGILNLPSNTLSMRVYNNVLYHNVNLLGTDVAAQHEIMTGNIRMLRVNNNVIFPADDSIDIAYDHYAYFINGNILSVGISSNCVYNASSPYVAFDSGATLTWEDWQSMGLDSRSINSNPILKDPGNNQFYLNTTSPCIGRGRDLGDALNGSLNQNSVWPDSVNTLDQDDYGMGWEIGAYVTPRLTFFAAQKSPSSTINIDGSMNDWAALTSFANGFIPYNRISKEGLNLPTNNNDLSANFSILYDSNFLYIGIVVTDDELVADSNSSNVYEDDSVEFYLDESNEDCLVNDCLTPSYPDNHQYIIDIANLLGGRNYDLPNSYFRECTVPSCTVPGVGYFVEYALSWSDLEVGAVPLTWSIMRTDVGVNEDDTIGSPPGDDRDAQIMWNGDGLNYLNTTLYGLLILSDSIAQQEAYCGDGYCQPSNNEDCVSCETDCGRCVVCGDGFIDGIEECDGSNLNGETCISRGFDGGTLSCYPPGNASECQFDGGGCTSLDTSPPVVSLVNPTQDQVLPAGTTETPINITTDEAAVCRYSTDASLITWDDMTQFPFSDSTNHSRIRTGLANGNTYYEYFLCEDSIPNRMTETTNLTFSVASPAPPSNNNGGGGGSGGGGGGGSGSGDEETEEDQETTSEQINIDVNLFENSEITITSQLQQLILTVDKVNERLMQIILITDTQITFTLNNEETTLSIGGSKLFTLDGVNIQITLDSITNGNAVITFKRVAAETPIIEETKSYLKTLIWIGLIAVATITTLLLARRKQGEPPFQKAKERVEEIRKQGYKDEQIKDMFRKKGWPEQAIGKVFRK